MGEWAHDWAMAMPVPDAVATLVHAVGLAAGKDEPLNMDAIQALNPILAGFSEGQFRSFGSVDHMAAGVSALLATKAPIEYRERLREHAIRLFPTLRGELDM